MYSAHLDAEVLLLFEDMFSVFQGFSGKTRIDDIIITCYNHSRKGKLLQEVLTVGKVDRNCKDIPMPEGAYADRYDGRVFILLPGENGVLRKKTIGHMTDRTKGAERMIPNQYFREFFPNQWTEAYPDEKVPFHEMGIGLYALTWGVCDCNNLYSILQDVYGPVYANSVLDYCMFTIKHRSNVALVVNFSENRTNSFNSAF